jgi:hypothetical protein
MSEEKPEPKKPVAGGPKGGTRFPRTPLKQAISYANRLVAKTHVGPQPAAVVLSGVFDSATTPGKIRASSLKQYGLMEGDTKAYQASQLAKDIAAAPEDEKEPLSQRAFLCAGAFKDVFDTFQGDIVAKGKLRQRGLNLEVHLDLVDLFVDLFCDSLVYCGLGSLEGDALRIKSSAVIPTVPPPASSDDIRSSNVIPDANGTAGEDVPTPPITPLHASQRPSTGKAGVTVNLDINSSLDTDKLARQLELLRQYGVI